MARLLGCTCLLLCHGCASDLQAAACPVNGADLCSLLALVLLPKVQAAATVAILASVLSSVGLGPPTSPSGMGWSIHGALRG